MVMAYGVIGNTTGFGPVILGSSPSRPTINPAFLLGFLFLWFLDIIFPPRLFKSIRPGYQKRLNKTDLVKGI